MLPQGSGPTVLLDLPALLDPSLAYDFGDDGLHEISSHKGWLAHVAFIPSLLADAGVPSTLYFHAYVRSHWVAELLQQRAEGEDW